MCPAVTLSFPCIRRRLLLGVLSKRNARTPQPTRASRNGASCCLAGLSRQSALWGARVVCCASCSRCVHRATAGVSPASSGKKQNSVLSVQHAVLSRQREWLRGVTSSVALEASQDASRCVRHPQRRLRSLSLSGIPVRAKFHRQTSPPPCLCRRGAVFDLGGVCACNGRHDGVRGASRERIVFVCLMVSFPLFSFLLFFTTFFFLLFLFFAFFFRMSCRHRRNRLVSTGHEP